SVTAGVDHATVLQGGGRTEALRARTSQFERAMATSKVPAERGAMRERLARLSGVVAVLRVGAATDVEREARRSQVEDALAATRAAVEEGIVPGGGVALWRASARLESLKLKPLEAAVRDIVAAALAEPARQIAMNAGAEGDTVVSRLRAGERWFGYDALTGEYGELDRA